MELLRLDRAPKKLDELSSKGQTCLTRKEQKNVSWLWSFI